MPNADPLIRVALLGAPDRPILIAAPPGPVFTILMNAAQLWMMDAVGPSIVAPIVARGRLVVMTSAVHPTRFVVVVPVIRANVVRLEIAIPSNAQRPAVVAISVYMQPLVTIRLVQVVYAAMEHAMWDPNVVTMPIALK